MSIFTPIQAILSIHLSRYRGREKRRTCEFVEAGFTFRYASETWTDTQRWNFIELCPTKHFFRAFQFVESETSEKDLNARNGDEREAFCWWMANKHSNHNKYWPLIYTLELFYSFFLPSSINWSHRAHFSQNLDKRRMKSEAGRLIRLTIIINFVDSFSLLTHTVR